jgi:hypothetical protein
VPAGPRGGTLAPGAPGTVASGDASPTIGGLFPPGFFATGTSRPAGGPPGAIDSDPPDRPAGGPPGAIDSEPPGRPAGGRDAASGPEAGAPRPPSASALPAGDASGPFDFVSRTRRDQEE